MVLDRLMAVNCQVVIESCKGIFFTNVVESLHQRKVFRHGRERIFSIGVKELNDL